MGALVVEGKSDREFQIIDGQQRLATLSLFALAVIDRLQRMADQGIDVDANRERGRELRSRFIGEKDPASLTEATRLYLNERDNPFYQDYLVQLREPLNPGGLPKSNRRLRECFLYFRECLAGTDGLEVDGTGVASLLSETLARQFLFILITVDDELNAYTVFETLNARGLELTTTDLLKNYLFSRVSVAADLEALQRRWRSLIATVEQARFPEFLRYHMLCELPRVRSGRLFKLVRDRTKTTQDVFALLDDLERRAELFSAVSDPNHGYWTERPEARAFIRELNLFRVHQAMPLLFASWESLREDFSRILQLVSVVSCRYTVISRLNTNALEPAYHGAARAVLDGDAAGPSDVFDYLRPIYVDDEKTRQDFTLLTVNTRGLRRKLAKYLLARLEEDAADRACDPDTDPGTIEHVLPESPAEDWSESFAPGAWEASAYRLGNLTLLEASANRAVGNATYGEKRAAYENSAYALTRRIPDMAPEQWTPELVDERQRQLAARAVHLWRSDFA